MIKQFIHKLMGRASAGKTSFGKRQVVPVSYTHLTLPTKA